MTSKYGMSTDTPELTTRSALRYYFFASDINPDTTFVKLER